MPILDKELAETLMEFGDRAELDLDIKPSFQVGDRVRTSTINPPHHTRLPRYARGKIGTVRAVYGVFPFPDLNSLGKDRPQRTYSVEFSATELWGQDANPKDTLRLDLWDDYLTAEGGTP